jgi:hypothetical protein
MAHRSRAPRGPGYGSCSSQEQTQIEGLVNLPTFLSVLALAAAGRSAAGRSGYAAIAGVAAAVATLFKVVFAPIFIALLLVTTVAVLRAEGSRAIRGTVLQLWLPYALGVAAYGCRTWPCSLLSARPMRCCGRYSPIRSKRLQTSSTRL